MQDNEDEIAKGINFFLKEINNFLDNKIIFGNDPNCIKRSFVKRISLGTESILELTKKGLCYDAHVIAGSLLEALALLDYIVSNNKIEDYYNYGTIILVKNDFLLQLQPFGAHKATKGMLHLLKEHTAKFLKPSKDINEVIAFLSDEKRSPKEKLNKIKESYNFFSYPNRNIEDYVEKTGNDVLKVAYENYCELKHYNSSALEYILSGPSYCIRKYSEETLKAQALSLLGLVLFHTYNMLQKWHFDEKELKNEKR